MLGVIGDCVQDVVVTLKEPIREATDTDSDIRMQRGGSAANVAAFAGPRYPTRFIGCVGDDLGGFVLRTELESHGVDVRFQTGDATGMIVVLVDDQGERMMFPSRGASGQLSQVDRAWLDDVELLHLTAYSFATDSAGTAVLDAADIVHANGGRVSFDLSSTGMIDHFGRHEFHRVLRRLRPEFISANEDETEFAELVVDGAPGPRLAEYPNTVVLARHGARSTRILADGELLADVPVIPVDGVRDLTGAGDSFNAGFLTDLLKNGDIVHAVEEAHRTAARVICCVGASEPPLEPHDPAYYRKDH